MRFDILSRKALGSALLALSALFANLQLLYTNSFDLQPRGRDDISLYLERFYEVREALPPHGVIGYLSDPPIEQSMTYLRGYYLTQYALAPLLVANTPDRQLVVGNFSTQPVPSTFFTPYHLTVVKDYGGGVMLLRGEGK